MKPEVAAKGADRKLKNGRLRKSVRRPPPGKLHWILSGSGSGTKPSAGWSSPPRPRSASSVKRRSLNAQAAFDEAERDHDGRAAAIEADRAAVEKRAQDEEARWKKKKEKLAAAFRGPRGEKAHFPPFLEK